MRISAKLFVGILCVVAVTGALGAYSVFSVAGMGRIAINLYEKPLLAISLAKSARAHFAQIDAAVNGSGSAGGLDQPAIDALQEESLEEIELARERILSAETQATIDAVHDQAMSWVAMNRDLVAGGGEAGARNALGEQLAKGLYDVVETVTGEAYAFRLAAEESVETQTVIQIAVVVANLVLALGIALILSRVIVRPLNGAISALESLSEGDTSVEIDARSNDEVGKLGRIVQAFKTKLIEMDEIRAAKEAEERNSQEEIRNKMLVLCDDLEQDVTSSVTDMVASIDDMTGLMDSMNRSAGDVQEKSQAVAKAAEQASHNVQTVASAAEEMSASSDEIGRQVTHATEITQRAVEESERTNTSIKGLAEAADRIGNVAELISEIAEQTNLLALNATIEAARAGDAGKSFAVVANEVKNLANQTAQATEQISGQISTMQSATAEAVDAIGHIGATNREIDGISQQIATSVGEQRSAIQEIATNAQLVSQVSQEVSSLIADVSRASNESGAQADESKSKADALAEKSRTLRQTMTEKLRESQAGDRREGDRALVGIEARLSIDGEFQDCAITDLSETGARCEPVEGLGEGEEVVLYVGELGGIDAMVAWVSKNSVGITFVDHAENRARVKDLTDGQQQAA